MKLGFGTGSIISAASSDENAVNTAYVQTFGIHIENLLISTITVFVICLTDYNKLIFR